MQGKLDYVEKKCENLRRLAKMAEYNVTGGIEIVEYGFGTDINYGNGVSITIYQNEIGLAWLDIEPWISAHTFLNKTYVEYLVAIRHREENEAS